MDTKSKLFQELINFAKNNLNFDDYFICVYGSCLTSQFSDNSDLDIFIATKDYSVDDFKKIRDFIIDLHFRNNLKIDEEIPYKNKLVVLYKDIKDAISLEPFIKNNHKYIVPPIKTTKKYLQSREVRLRLILNALTSPNKFIYGNKLKYTRFKKEAEKAIIQLAYGLIGKKHLSANEIIYSLTIGIHGEKNQSHLGYKIQRQEVMTHLKKMVKRNNLF